MVLFYIGLAGTAISLLFLLLGPKEGMEALGVGLVAYFNLLYHLVAGPAVMFWLWRQKRSGTLKLGVGLYFAVIYGLGLYGYVVSSGLDQVAVEKIAEISEPDSYRLRELGFQLFVSASSQRPVDTAALAEINTLIPRAESLNSRTEQYRPVLWYLAAVGEVGVGDAVPAEADLLGVFDVLGAHDNRFAIDHCFSRDEVSVRTGDGELTEWFAIA